jgi:outer membrane protein
MKRPLAIIVLLASGLALTAAAQTSSAPAVAAPAGPPKIAVIAFQAAVAQTNEFQRHFADLQKKFTPKKDQLKTQSDEIESLKKDLQTKGSTLTPAERATRTKAIDTKQRDLQHAAEDAQNEFQQEIQTTYGSLASKVGDVMIAYAKDHGFTLVLDFSQQQSPVLFAADSTNITKEVIDAYNVKSGVPAPPAQPATAAPNPPAAH